MINKPVKINLEVNGMDNDRIKQIKELTDGMTSREMGIMTKVCELLKYSPDTFKGEITALTDKIKAGMNTDQLEIAVDNMVNKAYRLHARRMN